MIPQGRKNDHVDERHRVKGSIVSDIPTVTPNAEADLDGELPPGQALCLQLPVVEISAEDLFVVGKDQLIEKDQIR